jgi:peroxiredoxin
MAGQVEGWIIRPGASGRPGPSGRSPWVEALSPGEPGPEVWAEGRWSRRMLRRLARVIILASIVAGSTWMLGVGRGRLDRGPGQIVGDFALEDVTTRRLHRLSEHRGRVVVVVFIGTSCPVGGLYMPRLIAMASAYGARGVDFLAIDSNASESTDEIASYARESGASFPVLKDPENRVADQLLAERTCEALVVDRRGRLRYRGAIDDQYSPGRQRGEPLHDYLAGAIEAVLAGGDVSPGMTRVSGCPIERTAPAIVRRPGSARSPSPGDGEVAGGPAGSRSDRTLAEPVTYAADVAPILQARCVPCHRPGQVAPFPLLTFEHARRWATSIAEVLSDGRMPPWNADRRYGRFSNDPSLTPREHEVLRSWVEQGAPPGDLSKAPRPPRFAKGWSIGTPDVVFEMPAPFPVPATGTVPIQRVRVATHLAEDLYLQAAEVQPGDRAVVHHICVFVEDRSGAPGADSGTQNVLAAYTPGDRPSIFPPGIGKRIPRGADLLFEVHYTPIGKARFDRSALGLVVCPERPRHLAISKGIANHRLRIPPGDPDYVLRAGWKTDREIRLLSLTPHMHLRGKSFRYSASYPDGRKEVLLSVPRFDFNWQSVYRLAEPKPIPAGTTIACEAHFDNSADNPANPDPKQTVLWGEQSWDEMMIGFIDYY